MKPEQQGFFLFLFNTAMAMFMIVLLVLLIFMIIGIYTMVTTSKGSYSPQSDSGAKGDSPQADVALTSKSQQLDAT